MSSDDTLPRTEGPTLDDLQPLDDTMPANDAVIIEVIPRGWATFAFASALRDLAVAFSAVEACGMALARQLDSQGEP